MQKEPAEITFKAVGLGLLLAFVFGSANAYLGMRAGQTVAATIPAAVIAMALFKLPYFRGTLQEQNIVRTAASVGEALVAGAIFTIPAFVMVDAGGGKLWADLRSHYWEGTMILLAGGLIGVFFIILLRRPLCVDAKLPWPESVASVEIVKAGEEHGDAPRYIFGAMGFAGLLQIFKSDRGLQIFREYMEGWLPFPRSVEGTVVRNGGVLWSTPSLSPALLGIGYIIGPRYSAINAAGGVLAWWVLVPLLLFFDPDLAQRLNVTNPSDLGWTVWQNVVRPIAVGAMLVSACHTLLGMRDSIAESLRGALSATGAAAHAAGGLARTERDIPARWVAIGTVGLTIPITAIYYHFTSDWTSALVAAVVMLIAGFLLSAVGGYLVGLVGSSNQPVSGLTLAALVIAALLMLAIGARGAAGMAAVLGVASVVCCACCVSGSLIQDLKAGHLLEGTPWKMEVVEIVAVVLLAFFLLAPIIALHQANLDTGGIGGRALPAPQAALMAQLTEGIVGGQIAWGLLGIGAAFGLALILCGAESPMLIAVGMYLPFDTSSAIFVGGVIKWLSDKMVARRGEVERRIIEDRGTLLASGLIAGEAIVGILLAVSFVSGIPSLTQILTGQETLGFYETWGGWLSLAGFACIGWMLTALPAHGAAARAAASRGERDA